ncbi:hypothetical protein GmRootA79_07140 [Acidovorax sp. A79]
MRWYGEAWLSEGAGADDAVCFKAIFSEEIPVAIMVRGKKGPKPLVALYSRRVRPGDCLARATYPPWNLTTSGTISSATMLMILISGLMAGPAVSL